MKSITTVVLSMILVASVCLAGSIQGEYVEARNADVSVGACFANSEAGLAGDLAVMGWKISKGSFEGVNLDGMSVVAVVRASATLGSLYNDTYPVVKSVLVIDEKANTEQRLALRAFARRMSGDLLMDVVRVDYQPIQLQVQGDNVHAASATLTAGNIASIATRAIKTDDTVCSHEDIWYQPLSKVNHFMPAFAMAHTFKGKGLDATWSSPDKRSAFVASFQLND